MKKLIVLGALCMLATMVFSTTASARPRPIIIVNPPTPMPQPIQSGD